MTSATITAVASGQSTYTHTYTYDALGNILTGPIGTYLYQGNTGTLKANPHAATSINGVTYTYDADGNLTTNGTLTNTWNYRDQITQSVSGGTTVNDYYDAQGNRVRYKVASANTYYPNKYYNDNGTKKTKQIYAGDQLVATIETVSAVVTPFYNHTDQLNSVTSVSNTAGSLVETLDYYPYGDQRISSGTYTGQRQYIGQIYDSNMGLDYLNARFYKANIGRFISEDPVFWEIGQTKDGKSVLLDPQAQNSYSYGNNNPIVKSDPTGRIAGIDDAIGFLGGAIVGSSVQLVSGMITGKGTSLAEFTGSFITGGIIGWGAINTPETLGASNAVSASVITGLAGGFYGNLAKQGVDIKTGKQTGGINYREAQTTGLITAATNGLFEGTVPNAKIKGLSAGKGNMNAVGKAMQTKMTNGSISDMSINTALKSAIGSQASGVYKTIVGGVADSVKSAFSNNKKKK